ncbi:hypothetical protein B0H13DRAFT_1917098 [Mycena leptocephala]|nr:hypothetical protein B0H13DRAFT_1917098 [Mycena leptocephala]
MPAALTSHGQLGPGLHGRRVGGEMGENAAFETMGEWKKDARQKIYFERLIGEVENNIVERPEPGPKLFSDAQVRRTTAPAMMRSAAAAVGNDTPALLGYGYAPYPPAPPPPPPPPPPPVPDPELEPTKLAGSVAGAGSPALFPTTTIAQAKQAQSPPPPAPQQTRRSARQRRELELKVEAGKKRMQTQTQRRYTRGRGHAHAIIPHTRIAYRRLLALRAPLRGFVRDDLRGMRACCEGGFARWLCWCWGLGFFSCCALSIYWIRRTKERKTIKWSKKEEGNRTHAINAGTASSLAAPLRI